MLAFKKPPIQQVVDHEAAAEFFGVPNGMWTKDVQRFESDMRRRDLKEGKNSPIYAGVVSIRRCYGGPEEGGWYYDWYQVEEILECQDFRHLLSTVRTLREEYPTCPRGRGSVIGGDDTIVYIARDKRLIEKMQSEELPSYE